MNSSAFPEAPTIPTTTLDAVAVVVPAAKPPKNKRAPSMLGFQTPSIEETCEICGSVDNEEQMLLCDGCNGGFHLYCLDPPMTELPKQRAWFCQQCTTAALGNSIESPNRPLVYEVGSILKKRNTPEDGVQYLIRWKVTFEAGGLLASHAHPERPYVLQRLVRVLLVPPPLVISRKTGRSFLSWVSSSSN